MFQRVRHSMRVWHELVTAATAPANHSNVFSVSFYSASLGAVCALCFMHSAELFFSAFPSLSSFLLFHVCIYGFLKSHFLAVYAFLLLSSLLCVMLCVFFCASLCDASIKSYRVLLRLRRHIERLSGCVGWIKGNATEKVMKPSQMNAENFFL